MTGRGDEIGSSNIGAEGSMLVTNLPLAGR